MKKRLDQKLDPLSHPPTLGLDGSG